VKEEDMMVAEVKSHKVKGISIELMNKISFKPVIPFF
jgi:hypothetical protein